MIPDKKNSRQSERRSKERRIINFVFGSEEWLNSIKQEYLLWPKKNRRDQDRRQHFRRIKNIGHSTFYVYTETMQNLLTEEEKQMLNELIQSDVND